ncbi:MAG TPA: carboxypeptidase regulatory-like domain-containing protein [Thermoanaerobaculia bacterium]|nr:carboxypeptidase regulatory-like domain-containing protein [Thermoanaerobaculia bacterium]
MKVPSPRFVVAVLVAALCISLIAVSGFAQFQTGNIFGKVQAKDASVLPGVTVTLTGIGAPQTFVTDATGNFRFLNLSPGAYSVKAELSGFGTAIRNHVDVNIGRNADVTMTLTPAAAESITVSAEAPLLDTRKAGSGINVSQVELNQVPTARDPWVILQQTPGVLMDRFNVGGNQSGQQSTYVSNGANTSQGTWNVDGVNITDFAATGSSPTYYDFGSFEELQMTTGGSDPRIQTPGVQVNMVTKRGTNDFKGSARGFHTSSSYQASPEIPSEAKSYLKFVNQINKIDDYGAEFGGPILKDKIWFWGAYGKQNIAVLTPTLLASGERSLDKTTLTGENIKVNAQPLASNSLVFVDSYDAKVKLGRNVGITRAPETGWNQNDNYKNGVGSLTDPTLWKIEDTQLIGSNLYLTGLYSKVQGGFQLIADNGKGCQSYACGLASDPAYFGADGSWHRSYLSQVILRPQTQYRLDGSTFFNTGSLNHEMKFGFGYRKADVRTTLAYPGGTYTDNEEVDAPGNSGFVSFQRRPDRANFGKMTDIYAGDTLMFGNLTVQAGLRYDQQKAGNYPGSAAANPVVPELLPAISFPGVTGLEWTNISPRVGLTYSLGSDKRTLLRASYNKYVDQVGGNAVPISATSPGAYSWLYLYYNDLNHDFIAQRNEIDFKTGIFSHAGFDPNNPTLQTQFTRWDPDLKAPTTSEFIVGAERELMSDFSVGVTATYRKMTDFIWTVGEKHQGQGDLYSTADYVLHDPVSATLPSGQTVSLPYYVLKSGISAPTYKVILNRPDYNQTYQGFEFMATKRMSNRWMLRGNLTLADWKQHVGANGIIDPTHQRGGTAVVSPQVGSGCDVCSGSDVIIGSGTGSGAFGGVYINSKWSYNITGVYQIPIVEANFGVNLYGRQGYALPYVFRVSGTGGEGFKFLLAENDVTQFRNKDVHELDLRLAKDLHVSRVGLTLSIDGFNVLNSQTILQRNVARLGVAASNRITETLSPRVFRLGARLTF